MLLVGGSKASSAGNQSSAESKKSHRSRSSKSVLETTIIDKTCLELNIRREVADRVDRVSDLIDDLGTQ